MNIADLLKEILGRTGLQRTNDHGMEKKPTDGENSGRTLTPETFMNQQKITKDPANVYDEKGNIVDYRPGGRSISDLLSAGKSGDNPFSGLIANGGSGQGTFTGLLSRLFSPTPEREAQGQVQGQGTVGGGDPNAGTPGTGIDPGLNPTPSKDQKVPAFAERTPTGTPTPLPLADAQPAPPPADYSMPNALDPQQIEELRGSLLTQSGQMNPDNPNSLAGRMGDPNSKVDMQDQMRQAEDISNAVQPLQKADRQPQGQLEPGNVDLNTRPVVKNGNAVSTVLSKSFNFDGREVLLPTVSDNGKLMSDNEAIQQYRQTGKHLGVFRDTASADAYAQKLHLDQERQYVK